MKYVLWYRLGDAADYEHVDSLTEFVDVLFLAGVRSDFSSGKGRIECDGFRGWNYVSAFWGEDGRPEIEELLTKYEYDFLKERISKLEEKQA